MKYLLGFIAIVAGCILGIALPEIPYAYYEFTAVAIIAILDSIFGGIVSSLKKTFNIPIFITGFFGNALIAIALVALGKRMGVDIYFAAIIVFVQRILVNFSVIRRILLKKYDKKESDEE